MRLLTISNIVSSSKSTVKVKAELSTKTESFVQSRMVFVIHRLSVAKLQYCAGKLFDERTVIFSFPESAGYQTIALAFFTLNPSVDYSAMLQILGPQMLVELFMLIMNAKRNQSGSVNFSTLCTEIIC